MILNGPLPKETRFYSISGLKRPVAFSDCDPLMPILAETLSDWKIVALSPSPEHQPVITTCRTDKGYERRSPWLTKPAVLRDPVDAVCDFIADLINAYVADHPGILCLHCAAVEFKKGLVLFPNTYRAGKSTLAVKLASCGGRLFSDDVLPLTTEENAGLALGILPRLRLPLPESASEAFAEFVAQLAGPRSERYLYVKLSPDQLAVRHTTAPVRGIVVLARGAAGRPELVELSKDTVLRDVIYRNFARENPALEIVDRLLAVVENARCFSLRYTTLEQAAELLGNIFGLNTC
jgi:hypothetical protein